MVLLAELNGTEHGLMGTTVDDVVIRLSAPTLNTIDVRRLIDLLDMDKPEVLLRGMCFFVPEPDDSEYWPDWKELSHPLTYGKAFSYFKDATTDPFHFYQVGKLFNDDLQQIESDEELQRKFEEEVGGTGRSVEELERIASKFYRKFTTRTVASVAIYREWGLSDPRQGKYFKWFDEKKRIRERFERGVEAIFDYVVGCIYGGTTQLNFEPDDAIRAHIGQMRGTLMGLETEPQRWYFLRELTARICPQNREQEFWPHFKFILKTISEQYTLAK